jgi:hypothetical protein
VLPSEEWEAFAVLDPENPFSQAVSRKDAVTNSMDSDKEMTTMDLRRAELATAERSLKPWAWVRHIDQMEASLGNENFSLFKKISSSYSGR